MRRRSGAGRRGKTVTSPHIRILPDTTPALLRSSLVTIKNARPDHFIVITIFGEKRKTTDWLDHQARCGCFWECVRRRARRCRKRTALVPSSTTENAEHSVAEDGDRPLSNCRSRRLLLARIYRQGRALAKNSRHQGRRHAEQAQRHA